MRLQELAAGAWGALGAWRSLAAAPGPFRQASVGSTDVDAISALQTLWQSLGQAVLPPEFSQSQLQDLAQQTHSQLRWAQLGFPAFNLTAGLAGSLLLTDCRGLRARDVRLPFEAFVVELPWPESPISFLDLEGRPTRARRLTVHRWQAFDGDESARAAFELQQVVAEAARRAPGPGLARLRALESVQHQIQALSAGIRFRAAVRCMLMSDRGVTVHTFRPWPVSEDDSMAKFVAPDRPDGDGMTEQDCNAAVAGVRLMVNLCVYLASLSHAPWSAPGATPLRFNRDGEALPMTWNVGAGIKLPRALLDAARDSASDGTDRAAWRLRSRFVVRGHFRNQARGPRLSERTRIWIAPHWKGPEDGPGLARLYDVGETAGRAEAVRS
jgi:hypothetical protein